MDTGRTRSALTQNTPFARNYAREVLELSRGRGVWLWDVAGNRYLDFGSGIAVNALGYGDRALARIVARQMRQLVHVSNLYATTPSLELGRRLLAAVSPAGREPFAAVHFGNSGAEANEAAIKYARLYARAKRGDGHHRILSFEHAFHGRTMGALSATPKAAYRTKFEPLVPGFEVAPFNDPAALERILDDSFAAVFVEAVQGEGGLTPVTGECAAALNELTRRHDVLLIADEIQTGLGRLGAMVGSAVVGLKPDIVTLSKPLAGGLPLSATLLPARVNDLVELGDHGTTFGGGPATSAAALHVLDQLERPAFLPEVARRVAELADALEAIVATYPWVTGVRGLGMLRGLVIDLGADQSRLYPQIVPLARDRGLLVLRSGDDVIRIAPPLTITTKEIAEGVRRLRTVLDTIDTMRSDKAHA